MKGDRTSKTASPDRRAFLVEAAKAGLAAAGVAVLATAKPKEARAWPYRPPRPRRRPRFRFHD